VTFLSAVPLWGYFIVLGAAFLTGHLLAFRPDPTMGRGRRMAGRWGSSLLLLIGLLVVSNRNVATILPAVVLAALGGVVSGRTAPAPPARGRRGAGPGSPAEDDHGAGGPREPGPDDAAGPEDRG
jgi:hypothetical protein